MTEPLGPGRIVGRTGPKPGQWTKQSAGAMFAGVAAFAITRDIAFERFRHTLPGHAYTATVLVGFVVAAVASRVALLWLRRLP
ncbi:hypothetical protein ACW4TU_33360 [Streptomyces sp. QTS52]